MRNIAAGFIAGSVFAGIAFLFIFDLAPRSKAPTEAQEIDLLGGEVSSQSNLETAPELSRSAPISQRTELQPADFPRVAIGAAEADPDERLAELGAIIEAANREALEIGRARWLADLGPVISPVPLPPEFDWLGESVFHEYMQREPIDSLSASSKEAQLMAYLISRPEIVQQYGAPTVRCHTIRCLVTWVSYGSSETEEVVQSNLWSLTDAADEEMTEPFACRNPGDCFSRAHVEDGLATAIWGVRFEGEEVVPFPD